MSRSNDGLPMLPPWLSDSEVTQVGQQIDYEAPPVQNLPHDELIEDIPAPKRRFKRPASEGDRADSPGPRKEKRRKPWRRDKHDDQQVDDHPAERAEGGLAPRPADQWSSPSQQQDLNGGWHSAPRPDQRPGPADHRPPDRSPESRPVDLYQSGPAQPYRPGPDNAWQQGPAHTGDRPPAPLPTRTPSEPPAEFQPLGPRPSQPVDRQPGPPSTRIPPHAPVPQQHQAGAGQVDAATPITPPQPHASSPQIPVAPHQPPVRPQQPVAPHQQPVVPPQQAHASSPANPIAPPPVTPQSHSSGAQHPIAHSHSSGAQHPIAQPQPHSSGAQHPVTHSSGVQHPVAHPQANTPGPQTPVAPQSIAQQQPHASASPVAPQQAPERLGPIEEQAAPSRDDRTAPADAAGAGDSAEPVPSPNSDGSASSRSSVTASGLDSAGAGQASAAEHTAVSEQGPATSAQPPSWLEGPRSSEGEQEPDRGPAAESSSPAESSQIPAESSQIAGGAMPAQTDIASSSMAGSPASVSSVAPADAPPSWLEPADSANTPAQPTAQRPLPRLPDLPPPPPTRSENAVETADSAASAPAPTPVASDSSAAATDRQASSGDVATDSAAAAPDLAVGTASSAVGPGLATSGPTSAPMAGDSAAPNVTADDSAAAATDRRSAPVVTTGSPTAAPDHAVAPESTGDDAARRTEFAARGSEPGPLGSATGNRAQFGDQARIPASEGRSDAASPTRGRHRLPSENAASLVDAPADQDRSASAGTAEVLSHQAARQAGHPSVADGPEASREASQNSHAAPAGHSSGFEHPLPSRPVTDQGLLRAPEQPWHSGQSAAEAEAALRATSNDRPPRSFSAPTDEPAPAPEPRSDRGAAAMGRAPVGDVRDGEQPWQVRPSSGEQQGRPAPHAQAPIAPGPDPRNPAPMRAPTDQVPGPQGYALPPGPMTPNQHPAAPHAAPHHAPEYLSAPQHPVQPQPPIQPQQPMPPQHSAPPQWQGGQAQPPLPSPSLDNVPIRGRTAKKPAGSGWRKAVHHVSGGAINPGMSAEERRLQELVARIRQPVRGDYRIAVLSLKGGVGKTTTTMGLGSTFASIRGDRVIAVDANPDFGTLSQRVPLQTRSTVRDLLLDSSIQRYSDVRRHTSQATSRLEVLASERDPAASEAFNEDEYRAVARILQRFYNIILTDCGTGLMHSAMAGVLELAHSLVLISSPAIDGARSAAATLDWLSLHGHDHLVRNAVVVINSPRAGSPNVGIQQLREYFLSRCRAVHIIPFDQHMSEGAEIDLHRLHKQTKRAYVELAATVADDFATDHRRYRG